MIFGRTTHKSGNPTAKSQSGNIVLMLFAGIAMVGVLGVATTNFMQGPLRSAVKITRQNTADTQMSIGGQVAIMAATNAANNGDCDGDGMIEPLEWLDKGALPAPIGGGLVPMNIGISKKDPWGTDYGYCVWDYGTQSLQTSCQETPGTNRRLQGTTNQAYPVVALVSAGPDKTFTTICRNFTSGPDRADQNTNGVLTDAGDFPLVGKANVNDDDIIATYTYLEAMAASGGLWTLKSSDPAKAVITKDLEVTGGATFTGTGTFSRLAAVGSDFLEVVSGLKLGSPTVMPTCNLANGGVMRLAADKKSVEICDGAAVPPAWIPMGGGGGGTTTMMAVAASGSYAKTSVGDFDIYKFTGNGTFEITELGNDPTFGSKIDYLVIGGGGLGGDGGGGGAGGVLGGSLNGVIQSYPIVVGAAGFWNGTAAGVKGKSSTFAGLEALGGGGASFQASFPPSDGGSGGGGNNYYATAGAGTVGQGYAGCRNAVSYRSYGGGGGAGGPCPGGIQPGPGITSAITGITETYACGQQGFDEAAGTGGNVGCTSGGLSTALQNKGHGGGSAGVVILKVKQRGGTAAGAVSAFPLKAPDGSAVAPSYSFATLPAKGLYVDSGSVRLSGLAAPTANDQAANKAYVDTAVAAAASGGVTYLGTTTQNYTGDLGGLVGANDKCRAQYGVGARFMKYRDLGYLTTSVAAMNLGWVGCDSMAFAIDPSYSVTFASCDGSAAHNINIGSVSQSLRYSQCQDWRDSSGAGYGFTLQLSSSQFQVYAQTCNSGAKIHCVK